MFEVKMVELEEGLLEWSECYKYLTIIIWQAILRSNGALSLANFRSGFYSTDHYHGNGPFVYCFCSREIQSRAKHKE